MKNIINIEKQVIKGKKALECLPKTDGNLDLDGVFKAIEFNTREFQKDLHGHKYKFKCTRNDVPIFSFDYWSDHELSTNEIGEGYKIVRESLEKTQLPDLSPKPVNLKSVNKNSP